MRVREKERTLAELEEENMGGAGGRKGKGEVMQLYFNFKVQKKRKLNLGACVFGFSLSMILESVLLCLPGVPWPTSIKKNLRVLVTYLEKCKFYLIWENGYLKFCSF